MSAIPVDEFHGVGGQYILKDGKRTRVSAPAPANATGAADKPTVAQVQADLQRVASELDQVKR